MKLQSILTFGAVFALAACGTPAVTYTATLNGAAEVPAVQTSATGTFTGTLDGTNLDVTGTYQGLSGPATLAHVHGTADASNTANAVCTLVIAESATAGTGTFHGDCTGTSAPSVADLNNGLYYVNIHTGAHQGGEIRGQISKVTQ